MSTPPTSYGSWPSPIDATTVYSDSLGLDDPHTDGTDLYWLEGRASEGGRMVLVRQSADGTTTDLTPPPWNVRSRVHEYGGGGYAVAEGQVVFVEFATGQVVRLDADGTPTPITPDAGNAAVRYGGLCLDLDRRVVFAVREDHRPSDREPVNTLVRLDLDGDNADFGVVLDGFGAQGPDFVSAPSRSPDGQHLAWVTWRHPDMPWDSSELYVGQLDTAGDLTGDRHRGPVAGGPGESVEEPTWISADQLVYISDRTGWANLYRLELSGASSAVHPIDRDFGAPGWVLRHRTMVLAGPGRLAATWSEDGFGRLGLLDLEDGSLTPLELEVTSLRGGLDVTADGDLVAICRFADRPAALARITPSTGAVQPVRASATVQVDRGLISRPEPVSWTSEDGATAYGFYYPPANSAVQGPADQAPPLIVMSHGGPTGATVPAFSLPLLYWTSRGYAVLDVNYGGSTGYGRAYRERLRDRWGHVDVADCVTGAEHLADSGRADRDRLAIRGGSAGGYTTLAALTFRDTFTAGASYYGVSDLAALAAETHKFESRYLDSLVGPWPQAEETYRERSPIHHVDRLSCPIILLQGLEDRVVPPNQASLMAQAARANGLPVAHLEFAGEGHGFRSLEALVAALQAEAYFYGRVFERPPADDLPEITIDNL